MSDPKDLQEAPASVTYSLLTPEGFNVLFTVREMSGTALLDKMTLMGKSLVEKGYKPQPQKSYGAPKSVEYIDGRMCPKDGGKLVKKVSKEGKAFAVCENGKYVNGVKSGCDHFEWL
jgi:hypothetical protein